MSRAMHEIQSDAMRLAQVELIGAIESCEWATVLRLTERIDDLAQRGLYHASQDRQKEITAFAMQGYKPEPDAR